MLLVMVLFLTYRVYTVVSPPEAPEALRLRAPMDDLSAIPAEELPPRPPLSPPRDLPGQFTNLYNRNPFAYVSGSLSGGEKREDPDQIDVQLLAIKEVNGRWRAQLSTTTARGKWYDENEEFEELQLNEIDAEEGTVAIYSTEHNREYTLSLP